MCSLDVGVLQCSPALEFAYTRGAINLNVSVQWVQVATIQQRYLLSTVTADVLLKPKPTPFLMATVKYVLLASFVVRNVLE